MNHKNAIMRQMSHEQELMCLGRDWYFQELPCLEVEEAGEPLDMDGQFRPLHRSLTDSVSLAVYRLTKEGP